MRFSRIESINPAIKTFVKDVHAIVAFSKKEEHISSMTELIDNFKDYPIKVICGTKTDLVSNYES
jgi:hypothetical protein